MTTRKEEWAALNLIADLINQGYTGKDIEEWVRLHLAAE